MCGERLVANLAADFNPSSAISDPLIGGCFRRCEPFSPPDPAVTMRDLNLLRFPERYGS
jgi:hypothetical protein